MLRFIFNLWPPFFFSGIRIISISPDWRKCRVKLLWRPWTRNVNGSQYGGSLYSMTDPVYATLLNGVLGWDKYYIWDKSAEIDYQKAAYGAVYFDAELNDEVIAEIVKHTENGEKYFPTFTCRLYDKDNQTIAISKRTLYLRLRPKYRPENKE